VQEYSSGLDSLQRKYNPGSTLSSSVRSLKRGSANCPVLQRIYAKILLIFLMEQVGKMTVSNLSTVPFLQWTVVGNFNFQGKQVSYFPSCVSACIVLLTFSKIGTRVSNPVFYENLGI
jgi:hypothetical protein